MKFKNYYKVRDWLESYIPLVYGKEELGLARIKYLLKLLANPEKKFKSIHVAGTSGKGSTCLYISQLLRNFELKVGLHISPHLVDIRERLQINGRMIPLTRYLKLFNELRPVVEKIQKERAELTPSYFEILVVAAFKYFAEEKVDWAVVEVGLGGRLDATNVLMPKVSVITNIGLDHTDILGKTIEKIAFEKAGIIKRSVPVVTGASGKAIEVIADVARERRSPLIIIDTQNSMSGLSGGPFWHSRLLAIEVVNLALEGQKEIETKYLKGVKKLSNLPGRLEEIDNGVILDGAHNPDKVRFLIDILRSGMSRREVLRENSFHSVRTMNKIILVVGFKKGKDWNRMVDLLLSNLPISEIIATKYQAATDTGMGSAVEPEKIKSYIETSHQRQVSSIKNSQQAVFEALKNQNRKYSSSESEKFSPAIAGSNNNLIVVTGSLYLVGEVRTLWKLPEF